MRYRNRFAKLVFLVGAVTLIAGCTVPLTRDRLSNTYLGYSESALSQTSIARVELGMADWAEVSGSQMEQAVFIGLREDNQTEYGSIALLPGDYHVEWGAEFGVSFLIDPRMLVAYQDHAEISLEGGHTYLLQMDRTYGRGYVVFSWIEDETTGQVVHGYKKP